MTPASVSHVAGLLGVTPRAVRFLCTRGRFKGAVKVGRDWIIPLKDGRPVIVQPRGQQGYKPAWRSL